MKKLISILTLSLTIVMCLSGCATKTTKTTSKVVINTEETVSEPTGTDWAKEAVFYEIFVRAFYDSDGDGIGDFNGITEKVDYLKELGVNAVWLMPIMETTTYHGYDIVDYYQTNPEYGSMDDFKNMLKTLHDNDIRVIIDYVANHTSDENQWFKEGIADVNSEYRDFYTFYTAKPELKDTSILRGNGEYKTYYIGYFDSIMPDLNYTNQAVRDEMKDVAKYWLDIGVDGFRLDASMHIDDEDPEVSYSWWREFTSYVKEINDEAFIVGENWDSNYKVIAPFYSTMDSSFDFPIQSLIENMSKGTVGDIVGIYNKQIEAYEEAAAEEGSVIKEPIVSTMLGNHDVNRIASKLDGDAASAKVAANLQFTLPGTPFIYYGEEIGQLGRGDDHNKRESFEWYANVNGEGQATQFAGKSTKALYILPNDGISYEEQVGKDDSMLEHYKKLIKMRKENTVLATGEYTSLGIYNNLYAYSVKGAEDGSKILVVHNLKTEDATFNLLVDGEDIYNGTKVSKADNYKINAKSMLILKYSDDTTPLDSSQFESVESGEYSVTIKVTLPEGTPMEDNIYIVGNFNSWNERDEEYIMTRTSDTTCEITISGTAKSSMEFKFTRGSWDMREQNAAHEDKIGEEQKENRSYLYEKDKAELNLIIETWSDM